MRFEVLVTAPALSQIENHYKYIKSKSAQNAEIWFDGIFNAIDSLENMPERCSVSRHSIYFGQTIRTLNYKRHIIDYRIKEDIQEVHILSVWHSATGKPPS